MRGVTHNKKTNRYEVKLYAGSYANEYDAVMRAKKIIEYINEHDIKPLRTEEMIGIYYHTEKGKWIAFRMDNGRVRCIRACSTKEEAIEARRIYMEDHDVQLDISGVACTNWA